MLYRRLVSAAFLVGAAVLIVVLDATWPLAGQSGLWLVPLLVCFALGTVWEASSLLRAHFALCPKTVTTHAGIAFMVCLFPIWYSLVKMESYPTTCPIGWIGWIYLGVLAGIGTSGVSALLKVARNKDDTCLDASCASDSTDQTREATQKNSLLERTTIAWIGSSFLIVYIVGCMCFWLLIRMHDPSIQGVLHLVSFLAIVKLADAGAFFVGKSLGRNKLSPIISPGKTIEGLVGGIVFAILAAHIFLRWWLPAMGGQVGSTWYGPALLGILLTMVGLVGDLLESMVKRMVGSKDSGAMLPGLGGVWDVTDSLLPTAIVGYLGVIAGLT